MSSVATDPFVPMPDTEHPHYASQAAGIRNHLHLNAVMVPRLRAMFATFSDGDDKPISDDVPEVTALPVKRCAGPAPFVGDSRIYDAHYLWRVAVDDLGRHVAGPAELQIHLCSH